MKCHKMREYKKKYSVSGYFPTHCGNFVWYAKNLPNIFAEASFEFSTMVCIKFPAKKIIKPILFPPSFSQMKLFRIFPLDTNGIQTKACDLNTTMDGHSFFFVGHRGWYELCYRTGHHTYNIQTNERKRKKPFNGTNINYIALAKEINYGFSMKIYYSIRTACRTSCLFSSNCTESNVEILFVSICISYNLMKTLMFISYYYTDG